MHASAVAQLPLREAAPYMLDRLNKVHGHIRARYSGRHRRRASASEPNNPEWVPAGLEVMSMAKYRYRPRYYPGTITLLKSEHTGTAWQAYAGFWAGLAEKLDVHIVPGNHMEIIRNNAESLGRQLSFCIERALKPAGYAASAAAAETLSIGGSGRASDGWPIPYRGRDQDIRSTS